MILADLSFRLGKFHIDAQFTHENKKNDDDHNNNNNSLQDNRLFFCFPFKGQRGQLFTDDYSLWFEIILIVYPETGGNVLNETEMIQFDFVMTHIFPIGLKHVAPSTWFHFFSFVECWKTSFASKPQVVWPLMSRTMNSNGKRCHEHIEPKVVMKKRIESLIGEQSLVGWLMKNQMGWSRLTTEKKSHWVEDIVEIAGVNGRERFEVIWVSKIP